MKKLVLKNTGITLVSLVITIIIMLILAGVSLSMVTGDSSVLGQAKKTAFLQEIAGYKEELAISFLDDAMKAQKKIDKATITARDEVTLRKYIPSMKKEDLDDYMIIAGELYYVGDDEFELEVCKEQGYITKSSGESAEEFADRLEGSAMEAIILQMSGGEKFMTKEEDGKIVEAGTPLAKKTSDDGFGSTDGGWRIITELKDDKVVATYADGWYYVKAGTEIETLGKLKYSYIINYTTKKAVRFDSNKHSIIASNGSLAVEDGIVYVADPTNMKDGSTASWGKAILHGFTGTEKDENNNVISGWTSTAFITDGIDDMVELPATKNDYSNGITIEFYGKILKYDSFRYEMIFTKGFSSNLSEVITLGLDKTSKTSWFGYSGHRHWAIPNFDSEFAEGKQFFISYRVSDIEPKGKIYLNNVPLTTIQHEGSNKLADIKEIFNDSKKSFYFGYGRGTGSRLDFSNLAINSIRVYNRYLSDDELTANYNATVSYYNILLGGGNADNNNNGGDDWDSVVNK